MTTDASLMHRRLRIPHEEIMGFAQRMIRCTACGAAPKTDCTPAGPDEYWLLHGIPQVGVMCQVRYGHACSAIRAMRNREKRDLAERDNPRTTVCPDGTVLTARMTRRDGMALLRFLTALSVSQPPRPADTRRVLRVWHEGILTADEMDEIWRKATQPDRPFTEHDRFPQWDVILSGFETSRARH